MFLVWLVKIQHPSQDLELSFYLVGCSLSVSIAFVLKPFYLSWIFNVVAELFRTFLVVLFR